MNKRTARIGLSILLVLLSCYPDTVFPQKSRGPEIEGSMLSNHLDPGITFNLAMKYNYWINPVLGFSFGAQFSYSEIDKNFDSPNDSRTVYYIDEDIYELNGIIGLKIAIPVYKNFGIMGDANFLFAPIPFYLVSVERDVFNAANVYPKERIKNKIVFTHFNPAYLLQLGVFYDFKTDDGRKVRIAAGYGISDHNPYNAYYHAKIDNIPLKNHLRLKPDKRGDIIFIRLSGF
jgi:hypothetical protein